MNFVSSEAKAFIGNQIALQNRNTSGNQNILHNRNTSISLLLPERGINPSLPILASDGQLGDQYKTEDFNRNTQCHVVRFL